MVRTVLVAASDPLLVEDATRVLGRLRYRLLTARTGPQALAALIACPIDLLVADMALVGLAMLLQRVDDDARLRTVPVLVLGAGEGRHNHLALLRKPFTPEQLGETVTAIVGPARIPTPAMPQPVIMAPTTNTGAAKSP